MVKIDRRQDMEAALARLLCSCFVAVDGTITLRADRVANAAKAIASRLQSDGFLGGDSDMTTVERAIHDAIGEGHEMPRSFSVPAGVVAHRIRNEMDRVAAQ